MGDDAEDFVDDRCGTYAGWNAHKRHREKPCDACRAAQTAYARAYRKANPDKYAEQKRLAAVHTRAAWRLVDRHREEWRALVVEEMAKEDTP